MKRRNLKMENNKLLKIVNNFENLNIAVIGDIMLDKYIWGKVDRVSPEAPVPVVSIKRTEYRVGGAGNVSTNLSSLKCRSIIMSITGSDQYSIILKDHLNKLNVDSLFEEDETRCTTVKSRIVAQKQQLIRMDQEITQTISKNITNKLLSKMDSYLDKLDALIISDYDKGLLSEAFINKIIKKYQSIPIIVDPKVRDYNRYKGATIIKPNYKEFCEANNKDQISFDKFDQFAEQIINRFNFAGLIVTLGKNGVYYFRRGESEIIPTEAHEVYDVSGAGDTFTAAFTASFVITNDLAISARIGNLAAAVAVEKVGTATVTKQELIKKIAA